MKSLSITPLPSPVEARVAVPGSKSYTLRALLLAAMSPGKVTITNPLSSDDTESMLACLQELGLQISRTAASIDVAGDVSRIEDKDYSLDAGLSGVTLRFMLALSCVIPGRQRIGGQAGLEKRPVADMVDSLKDLGAEIEYLGKEGFPPVRVSSSSLRSGKASISGEVSSQYLSALLMTAPLAGGLDLEVTGSLGSKPYVDMTLAAMADFGVKAANKDYRRFTVAGGQNYGAGSYVVEGDVSSACYFFAVAALTESTITVSNLNPGSLQADMAFLKILERMGSKITAGKDSITVAGKGVRPLKADMSDCPDQAQTLAVLAAFAGGRTLINGVKSLRVKETERVKALQQELKKMGIRTEAAPDSLTIYGGNPEGAAIDTYGDHRMAMSFAVAGSKLEGMRIKDPEVVAKSFPGFWERLAAIGVGSVRRDNIVLIGMRGTGKTTIARALARKLGMKQLDLDQIMSEKLSLSTPEIVAKHGWGYFRDQEAIIAKDIAGMKGVLISTGGGIVLRPDNIDALGRNGVIVLLSASLDTMVRRLEGSRNRPALTDKKTLRSEIQQVRRERQHLYQAAADVVINTDGLTPSRAADRIIDELGISGHG